MKAIVVKTLPPTNTKPARLKVIAEGLPPLVISIHKYAVSRSPAQQAVREFCKRHDWEYDALVQGTLPTGEQVFVFAPDPVNREGLTYNEWLAATGSTTRTNAMNYAWSGGEDPAEYRNR